MLLLFPFFTPLSIDIAGVDTPFDPQFNLSFVDIYTSPYLHIPWYPILGNHDYRKSLVAQIEYSLYNPYWIMKDTNYSIQYTLPSTLSSLPQVISTDNNPNTINTNNNHNCISFIFIDTCPFIQEYYDPNHWDNYPQFGINIKNSHPQALLLWLEEQLIKNYQQCIGSIVIGHHPIYTAGIHGDSQELVQQFKPLFDKYGVDMYIAGHDHTMVHLRKDDIDYIITGAGSRVRSNNIVTPETIWIGDVPGFTIHSMNSTHILTSYIHANGDVIHQSFHPLRSKGF